MSIISDVKEFVSANSLIGNETLIVGCSGGADSVALLRILHEITSNDIHVVHVNHNLRGEESDGDEAFVVSLCQTLGIPCKVYSFDVAKKAKELKRSLEETGRILRYQAFDEYAKDLFGDEYIDKTLICLAHHKDDLAETMLMNLFRGSGLDGLITPKVKAERLCRPLLCVSKSELIKYLDSINQEYRTDATNFLSDCTRNIWRNEVIPLISNCANKTPSDALYSTYELLRDDDDYITHECDRVFDEVYDKELKVLDVKLLRGCHKAISSRIIRRLWMLTFGDLTDIEKVHVDGILGLTDMNKSSGTTIDLPFGRIGFVVDGRLGLCYKDNFESFCKAIFEKKGFIFSECEVIIDCVKNLIFNTELPQCGCVLSAQIVENREDLLYNINSWFYPIYGDYESLNLRLGNLNGELRFGRAGSDSHKRLSRLLMDLKIPGCIRNQVWGVYSGDEALWIPGIGHSTGFVDEISYMRFAESNKENMPENYLVVSLSFGG